MALQYSSDWCEECKILDEHPIYKNAKYKSNIGYYVYRVKEKPRFVLGSLIEEISLTININPVNNELPPIMYKNMLVRF